MMYYLGSHWLWGGGGCEALQQVRLPAAARLEGGAREITPKYDLDPSAVELVSGVGAGCVN